MQSTLYHLLRKFTDHTFVKVSLWSSVSTVARMVSGLLTIKLSALYIGAVGLAIVSQYTNAIVFIGLIGSGCINQGLTTYIARLTEDYKEQEIWIRNGISTTLITSLFFSLIVFLFRTEITFYIFDNLEYQIYTLLLASTLVLVSANTTLIGILNGFKEYKTLVQSNVWSAVLALVLGVILIPTYGLKGALINAWLNQTLLLIVTLTFVRKKTWARNIFRITHIEISRLKMLLGFSIMVVVNSTLPPATLILVRNTILKHFTLEQAGYWDATTRLTNMLLMVLMTTYTMYYLPRIAELKTDKEVRSELWNTLKLIIPLVSTLFFLAYLFRDIIIYLAFNDSFSTIRDYLGIQLLGEFLRLLSWFFVALFYAKERVKWFVISEIKFYLLWFLLTNVMISYLGMQGVFWSYVVASLVYLVFVVFFFRKTLFYKL